MKQFTIETSTKSSKNQLKRSVVVRFKKLISGTFLSGFKWIEKYIPDTSLRLKPNVKREDDYIKPSIIKTPKHSILYIKKNGLDHYYHYYHYYYLILYNHTKRWFPKWCCIKKDHLSNR